MTVDPRTLVADMHHLWPDPFDYTTAAANFIEQVVVPLHDAWLKANPPCPTCGGDGCFHEERMHSGGDVAEVITGDCSDCPESPGVLPFDKWTAGLVALWTAVRDYDRGTEKNLGRDELWSLYGQRELLDELRRIGAAR